MKNSIVDELKSLKEIYDSGGISQIEYELMKSKLLDESLESNDEKFTKLEDLNTNKVSDDNLTLQKQLEKLKEMHSSGAISQDEMDLMKAEIIRKSMAQDGVKSAMEPSAFSKFFRRNKKLLISLLIIVGLAFFSWWYFQPDVKIEGTNLANNYCECQEKSNLEYIKRLEEFLLDFDNRNYKYAVDVENDLDKLKSEFEKNTLKTEIYNCFSDYNVNYNKNEQEYLSNTGRGKDFWFTYQSTITQNRNLESQRAKIQTLTDSIEFKLSSLSYSNPEEFQNRKEFIISRMNNFYSDISYGNVDAYNYFAYRTERYYGHKNISPTNINNYFASSRDYESPSFKIITETLDLKSKEKGSEIWVFAVEFRAYRPSKQKYQVSNVLYEVKFNSSDKITSYRELKVENTKYFESEYNESTNSYEEQEYNDW